jgi:septum formation protein
MRQERHGQVSFYCAREPSHASRRTLAYPSKKPLCLLQVSRVRFAKLSPVQIAAYIASGEPFGKAGAYGIQGLGGAFIPSIEGSYSGIMGLPIFETAQLLERAQVTCI